jgi:hypothetical protein
MIKQRRVEESSSFLKKEPKNSTNEGSLYPQIAEAKKIKTLLLF